MSSTIVREIRCPIGSVIGIADVLYVVAIDPCSWKVPCGRPMKLICCTSSVPPSKSARRAVALHVNAVAAAVLVHALPGDDEVAVHVHRHVGVALDVLGLGVDHELAARRIRPDRRFCGWPRAS